MAKREIPEINAGSMADIAFLLLLFFLVTTTMDKDQAYIRSIPKKIEKQNNDNQEIDTRYVFHIYANDKNELILRDRMGKDMSVPIKEKDSISEMLYEWYMTNREFFDESRVSAADKMKKYENQFPWYSASSASEYKMVVDAYYIELDKAEQANSEKDIQFISSKISEAQKKQKLIKQFYGNDKVPEISDKAHVRIEVQNKTSYELFAKIQSEVEEALYKVRDEECKAKFGESYGIIKGRVIQDEEKYKEDKLKMEMIELLFPSRIIEVKPTN